MGKFSNSMQIMQFAKRGSYSRGSWIRAALARSIDEYLSEIYVGKDVVIDNNADLAGWGVDPEIFSLIYRGWNRIVVSESGVLVTFLV